MTLWLPSLLFPHQVLLKIIVNSTVDKGQVDFYLLGAEAHLIALCAVISRVFCEESSCNYLYEVFSLFVIRYEVIIRHYRL